MHLLFDAVQGSDEAASRLKRKKPAFARVVAPLRKVHEAFLLKSHNGNGVIKGGAVADMSCLIGEMHLQHQGEYEKAVEAFTRAIDTQPAADLYEGRARACPQPRRERRDAGARDAATGLIQAVCHSTRPSVRALFSRRARNAHQEVVSQQPLPYSGRSRSQLPFCSPRLNHVKFGLCPFSEMPLK